MSCLISTRESPSDLSILNCVPSPLKTLVCAIVIIFGIGGLTAAGIGLNGYLQVGGDLGRMHSIVMMTVGGGAGIPLLIVGIVGAVKNHPNGNNVERSRSNGESPSSQIEQTHHQPNKQTEEQMFLNADDIMY